MMKKTLFLLSALLLAGIGAKAQETVHKCEAVFNDWSISGNSGGSFQRNTWSTEEEAAGMVTPFIEYWVGTGSVLSNATISHTALTGLETGYYEVSIFARAFNEGSTTAVSKGITFTANDESVDLTEGTKDEYNDVSEEVYYTYNLLVYVENGTLDIGFTVSGVTACDWMAFKNLEVTYLGDSPVGYAAHQCEAMLGHWTIAQSGSVGDFHLNTWSSEADPSGMVIPFLEYWVANGSTLSPATISHETIKGLTAGYYEISIDIRIFSEAGNEITLGGTLTANTASENLLEGSDIHSGTYGTETLVYGTCHLLTEVTEAGTLDVSIVIPENVPYNWISFKNLKVVYDGESAPTLDYVTGDMNADVEAAMKAAVDQYNSTFDADDYTAALAAIEEAEESVAQYAEIAALVAALDETGATAWASTASGTAYAAKSLTTSDDITDDMVAAQKAQTTANTDWSYVLKNTGTWVNAISATNFQDCPSLPTAHEVWSLNAWELPDGFTSADAIYKRIEDLPAGEYTISFYAYGSEGENASRPLAFANNSDQTEVAYASALAWSESSLYTMSCTVNVSGELNFGMKTQGDGNWYVMEGNSLTLVSLAAEATDTESDYKEGDTATIDGTEYTIKSDNMVENHSFELGFTGWTNANDYATEIIAENFDLRSDAQDGNVCLVGTVNGGASAASSLGKAWSIETGKTYYFSYYVKGLTENTGGTYLKTSLTSTAGTETDELGYPETVSSDWQKVEYVFDNESYAYVQVEFRWLNSQWAFDNFQLYEVEEATEETIEWEMTEAGWGTMILPFDASVPSGLTMYAGDALTLDSEGTTITVGDASETIAANTPYLVSGSAATYEFTGTPVEATTLTSGMLTGTLVDMTQDDFTADGTEYVLQNHEDEGLAFYPITSESTGVTLTAYHCYLTLTSGSRGVKGFISLPGDAGEETGIVAVEGDVIANDAIYDLSGRRVSKAVKGVYIQNGKKVLVK